MATRKMANGEGSVTQRSNGTWMAQAYLETADGTRKRVTTYGRTRAEAWQAMEDKKADGARGRRPSSRHDTVAEYLKEWLEYVHKPAVLPTSYMRTKSLLETHVLGRVASTRLDAFHPRAVDRLLGGIQREGASADTAHKVRAVLHKVFADAVARRDLAVNPVSAAFRPKVERKRIVPFKREEVEKLLQKAPTPRLRALVATALLGGLRYGELAALRWRDVDLEEGCIHVRRNLRLFARVSEEGKPKLTFEEGDPKTKAGRRTVWPSQRVLDALKAYRGVLPALPHGTVRVFASPDGRELRHQNFVRREWRPLCELAEVPVRTFHATRHTATTLLAEAGVDPETVRAQLGHADITTTLRHYTHTTTVRQQQAARSLDALLGTT
jgi:integrase